MRKYILSLLFLVIASIVSAQQKVNIKVWKGGKAEIIEQIDSVTFPNTMQHLICIDLGLSVKWASCNLGAERRRKTISGTDINITNPSPRR